MLRVGVTHLRPVRLQVTLGIILRRITGEETWTWTWSILDHVRCYIVFCTPRELKWIRKKKHWELLISLNCQVECRRTYQFHPSDNRYYSNLPASGHPLAGPLQASVVSNTPSRLSHEVPWRLPILVPKHFPQRPTYCCAVVTGLNDLSAITQPTSPIDVLVIRNK